MPSTCNGKTLLSTCWPETSPVARYEVIARQKLGHVVLQARGRLSNDDDDDGSKKVDKKMNLRPFKLYCVHLNSLNLSKVGDFFVELNS